MRRLSPLFVHRRGPFPLLRFDEQGFDLLDVLLLPLVKEHQLAKDREIVGN
jgi:hypothetical protein